MMARLNSPLSPRGEGEYKVESEQQLKFLF